MLNRLADLIRLRAYADTLVHPVRGMNSSILRGFAPGDHVSARIESAQPNGTFRATVENQSFDLRLPFRAQPGDVIPLRVAAREPRLKFVVEPGTEQPAPAARLSTTARFITALLAESEKLPLTAVTQVHAPLLENVPPDSNEIVAALRNALARSGIFYESHQAEWIAGERPLATLLNEPQAQFPPLRTVAIPPSDPADAGGKTTVNQDETAPRLPDLPVHRDALPIVRQQLETLDTRHILWNGLIWQGQPLEWDVAEQAPEPPATSDAGHWRTQVKLRLPRLGDVSATLLVTARGVAIHVCAGSPDTVSTLATHRQELQQSLNDAGVRPLDIAIDAHETV